MRLSNYQKNKLIDAICDVCDQHGLIIEDGPAVRKIAALVDNLMGPVTPQDMQDFHSSGFWKKLHEEVSNDYAIARQQRDYASARQQRLSHTRQSHTS
jgi:hypothetical protein